jgi:hypothetical protein
LDTTEGEKSSVSDTYTPNGPAPMVTPDGSYQLTARRPGRELFPASWLRHRARIIYDGGSHAYDGSRFGAGSRSPTHAA